jgi:hypothetical protein
MAKKHAGMGLIDESIDLPTSAVTNVDESEETSYQPPTVEPPKIEEQSRPRQGNQPLCPIHGTQMVAYSTGSSFTYYRCTENKCRETAKRLRPIGLLKNLYGNGKSARISE